MSTEDEDNLMGERSIAHRIARSRTTTLVSSVVLVAALVVSGIFEANHQAHQAAADAQAHVAATASAEISQLLSYNYSALPEYQSKALSLTTGTFHDEFQSLLAGKIIPAATEDHIVTQATVPAVSVISASGTQVTVLAFINQLTLKSGLAAPSVQGSRVIVTFSRVRSSWRISGLKPV